MALQRRLKNFFKRYSDVIVKVREATSNDPWGPSGSLMKEIAEMSYHMDSLSEIMPVLWQRLNDSGKNWRHVYKSLVLLDYLLKNGSKQVMLHCHERISDIWLLSEFKYIDEAGKDQGFHVRQKSRKLVDLLTDEQSLKLEREKAQHIKMQMFLSTFQSMHKLQPTVPDIGSVIEKQQAQHIEKPQIDSPSCTVEKISSIQPVQDLMIFEDKAQLLYVSSEDQQAALAPLDSAVSPHDSLKTVIPTSPARGQLTSELTARCIESLSNVHRPSGLYPSTSIPASNPQCTGLHRGTASLIPPGIGFQSPSPTSVLSVVPKHPTNPFL